MTRLAIGIIIFMISIYTGISIKRFYSNKCKIYDEMLDFVLFTQGEIQFFGTNINDLIQKYCNSNSNLLSKALKSIQIPDKSKIEDLECIYLSEKGKNLVLEFINSLSKLNSCTQKEYLDNFKNKIIQEMQFSKTELDGKGDVYKKLSPFVGLAIAIVIF